MVLENGADVREETSYNEQPDVSAESSGQDDDDNLQSGGEDGSESEDGQDKARDGATEPREDSSEENENEPKPEEGEEHKFSASDKADIDKFISRLRLPKGVTYKLDDAGDLKFLIPINGRTYIQSPEDVFRGYGLAQASHQRLNEAKKLSGDMREYFASIKENPARLWELAEKLGHDPADLARMLLEERVREAEMTPEERARVAAETEAEQLRKENEEFKNEKTRKEYEASVETHKKRLDTELTAAMRKHGFDRSNTKIRSKVLADAIGKLMLATQAGQKLSPEDAVFLAKQEWQESVQDVYSEIGADHILDIVPKQIIEAIRKADLSRLSSSGGTPTAQTTPSFEPGQQLDLEEAEGFSSKKKKTRMSMSEFFESL